MFFQTSFETVGASENKDWFPFYIRDDSNI